MQDLSHEPLGFEGLGLVRPLLSALRAQGYGRPTPIQAQAIPPALAGRDVIGCAQTGTGKTAAFALPILQRIDRTATRTPVVRALVLTPTRELALQIDASFETYGRNLDLYHTVVFGGVKPGAQVRELRRGVDILVATPGRLIDLMGQGVVTFDELETLVLDEADRMLDMGFIADVRRILRSLPTQRQTLLFSATMPPDVVELASSMLTHPVDVSVVPESTTVEQVEQRIYFVETADKRKLLAHLLRDDQVERALVFSRTKHGANRLARCLEQAGVACAAIHGNKSQGARERALEAFRSRHIRVLLATDIAARGIDIEGISHVVNFDLPNVPETYVHRIGRTARAGATGTALSFCDEHETPYLADIERLIGMPVARVPSHPYPARFSAPPATHIGLCRRLGTRAVEPPVAARAAARRSTRSQRVEGGLTSARRVAPERTLTKRRSSRGSGSTSRRPADRTPAESFSRGR